MKQISSIPIVRIFGFGEHQEKLRFLLEKNTISVESHEKLVRRIVLIAESAIPMNTRQKFVSEPQYLRVVLTK